ncbi:hypothetical protein OAE35_01215 [Synechococcus sp. AH-551-E02]|nr:hypothetical protein [Synechococcus sp. AH-551-E02]MDB4653501.1 hypothetical protein [Synechococcus sp. AH-551-E02]
MTPARAIVLPLSSPSPDPGDTWLNVRRTSDPGKEAFILTTAFCLAAAPYLATAIETVRGSTSVGETG